ncbi:MAG TPA: hypothetical protein DCZ69_12775 [Syntrophobacteraceae bacterium]|nr:hypothetical protein [Syntrophobacteraceae bacterium]
MESRNDPVDPETIQEHVRRYYARLFARGRTVPEGVPIPTGRQLAMELGYPPSLCSRIPDYLWDLFAPCGNPLPYVEGGKNPWVLNLGCGVGIDSLALTAAHPGMHVVGADAVWQVVSQANRGVDEGQWPSTGLHWLCGDATRLPFRYQCFDAVLLNGVFNLFADKPALLKELRRVLKPRAHILIADLCNDTDLPDQFAQEADAWAWCMSGALALNELRDLLGQAGFGTIEVREKEDAEMFFRTVVTCRKSPV